MKLRGNSLDILGDQLFHAGTSSDDEKGNVVRERTHALTISPRFPNTDAEDEGLSTHQAEQQYSFANVFRAI